MSGYSRLDDRKVLYSHSPVTIQVNDKVSFSVAQDGKVKITVIDGDVEDQVEISASVIYRIKSVLANTRQAKLMSPEEFTEARKKMSKE